MNVRKYSDYYENDGIQTVSSGTGSPICGRASGPAGDTERGAGRDQSASAVSRAGLGEPLGRNVCEAPTEKRRGEHGRQEDHRDKRRELAGPEKRLAADL